MTLGDTRMNWKNTKDDQEPYNCFKGETKMPGNKYTSEKYLQP